MTDDIARVAVRAPIAPLMAEPRVACAQISQYLAGRVLDVVETRDAWFRVRGADDYEGWLHRGYVAEAPHDSLRRSVHVSRVSLGCVTTSATGARRSMPLGAFLSADERVKTGDVIEAAQQVEEFPRDPLAITRSAQRFFEGTSYLWGGVTPWGADCSGLVQSTFWLHGIQLHRDAWQQAEEGEAGDADPMNSRAGDLLFFSDRADRFISHVAIALGSRCLVHLALGRGGFGVENLSDDRDPYVRTLLERFVTSRRVLQ